MACTCIDRGPVHNLTWLDPTPSSPGTSPRKTIIQPQEIPGPNTPVTPPQFSPQRDASPKNSQTAANDVKPNIAVLIPPLSAQAKAGQYTIFPDSPPSGRSKLHSKKRKRDTGLEPGLVDQDQRRLEHDTLKEAEDLAQDIFEADNQAPPNPSGTAQSNLGYFISVSVDGSSVRVLSPAVQLRLEPLLHRVIASNKYVEIPVENLMHLQKLCEGALALSESTNFEIESGWGEDEISKWTEGVEQAQIAARSARTILRTMTGSREEKELYSEELLQAVVDNVKRVMESCIVPIVECRTTVSGSKSELFLTASSQKKIISQLLSDYHKVLKLLAEVVMKVDLSEGIITAIEFFAIRLIFVENAHIEKESVLGIHRYEVVRHTAMDIIAEIFSRYPEQRGFLFDEILLSLQKLPVTRQHARQYRLTDGANIQLVSALLMRLVQTSAMRSSAALKHKSKRTLPSPNRDKQDIPEDSRDVSSDDETDSAAEASSTVKSASSPGKTSNGGCIRALERLSDEVQPLSESTSKSAQYIVGFFVERATGASKTGDQPHRHLLDIFIEDLVAVLGSPEWPGAEILLRTLLAHAIHIVEHEKSTAPAKNMALEMLGLMGSAISELVVRTRSLARSLENDGSSFSGHLMQLLEDYLEEKLDDTELSGWEGPYRAVLEYLQIHRVDEKQSASAQGYCLTQWAKTVASANLTASVGDSEHTMDQATEKLAIQLRTMLPDSKFNASGSVFTTRYSICQLLTFFSAFPQLTGSQARLAYALTLLRLGFCQAFDRILRILFDSITSEQITVRTRSLKSITHMLDKDPTLLDRMPAVVRLIIKCASDRSSMVRDSALILMGKCVVLRPALEKDVCNTLLSLTNDTAIGVRKRAMKLLKDIYARDSTKDMRIVIADSLLHRIKDSDKSVSDLALQIFEESWFSRFWTLSASMEFPVAEKVAFKEQISLIVRTVQRGNGVAAMMTNLIREILSNNSKNATANFQVCNLIVTTAFEGIIDIEELPQRPQQRHVLQMLTIFAQVNPRLFTAEQLHYLQPYIANLSNADDVDLFRSVVIILRCVLPILSTVQHGFLREVQDCLLANLSKLGKSELNEVIACLWTINGVLQNPERLNKLAVSVLKNMHGFQDTKLSDDRPDQLGRVKKYIRIAGLCGKHCNFEEQMEAFEQVRAGFNVSSVAGLLVSSIKPFAEVRQPLSLRAVALDNIGLICQTWPDQFNQQGISNAFQAILEEGNAELQTIIMLTFRDFFTSQDRRLDAKDDATPGEANVLANSKLGGSMIASNRDGAAALIAQRFMQSIIRIALASQDTSALTATQVIASINRQGLVHPKESGPALVALETSTNRAIAEVAFQEHHSVHRQYESMFEREYMRAIHEAFIYQRDIVKNTSGVTTQPYASKLRSTFEIIMTSKGKYQKKFLSNLCARIDFDPVSLDVSGRLPRHLEYSRFLVENLAFFEYGRMDELLHTIACMEKLVAATGTGVAHSISVDVFHLTPEKMLEVNGDQLHEGEGGDAEKAKANIKPVRLRQLTTASIILSILWDTRTHLRRLYGLNSQQRRENKGKPSIKELNRAPTKVQGLNGDRLMITIAERVEALDGHESMLKQCQSFVDLLSIDNELKVAAEDEDEIVRPTTPSDDDEGDLPVPASGAPRTLKRKNSASVNGTPQKKRKARPSLGKRKKSGKSVEGNDGSDY